MNPPLPSFTKIRIIFIILGIILISFLLGIVKNLWAGTTPLEGGTCRYFTYHTSWTQNPVTYKTASEVINNLEDRVYLRSIGTHGPPWGCINLALDYWIWNGSLWLRDGSEVFTVDPVSWDTFASYMDQTYGPSDSDPNITETNGCTQNCTNEYNALITQCYGEEHIESFDENTCTGTCEAPPDYSAEYSALIQECFGEEKIGQWNPYTCFGTCKDGCEAENQLLYDKCNEEGLNYGGVYQYHNNPPHCNNGACKNCSDQYKELQNKCGTGNIAQFYWAVCEGECKTCDELLDEAIHQCKDFGGVVDEWNCIDNPYGKPTVKPWKCRDRQELEKQPPGTIPWPEAPPSVPPELPPDYVPPVNPPSTLPDTTPDWLKALKESMDEIGRLASKEAQSSTLTSSTLSDRSIKDDINALEVTKLLKSIDKKVGNFEVNVNVEVPEPEIELFEDVGLTTSFDTPYEIEEEYDISNRFSGFISTIRATGVFALPNQFFNSIPSGGSPTTTIDMGTYGSQTVDLSYMSEALLILRSIVLLSFSFLAIRVVILKR